MMLCNSASMCIHVTINRAEGSTFISSSNFIFDWTIDLFKSRHLSCKFNTKKHRIFIIILCRQSYAFIIKGGKFLHLKTETNKTKTKNMSSSDSLSMLENQIIEHRFLVGRSIGKGSFGEVYDGYDKLTGQRVAIKFESHRSTHSQLDNEYQVYKIICGGEGIPGVIYYGSNEDYDYLVMELLGPSLEKLFNFCRRRFTLKTVLMLGEQMIGRVEYLHQMSHLHRDLKPDNFVINAQNGIEVFLIDFGLARRYCQLVNNQVEHIKRVKMQSFTGTARYASIDAQQQYTTSRKDDLESLGYILVYFLKSKLPWQQVPKAGNGPNGITAKQRKERILELKMSTKISDICNGLPFEFQQFLCYCRSLNFDEKPNYCYLRRLLGSQFERNLFVKDWVYDWDIAEKNCKKTKKNHINIK